MTEQRITVPLDGAEETEMTLKATFAQIEEKEDLGPDEKLVEAADAYRLEHPDAPDAQVYAAVFKAMPKTHQAYLFMNGER